MASSYLNDYVYYVIGIVGGANTDVKQELIPVDGKKKNSILIEKLKDISQNDSRCFLWMFYFGYLNGKIFICYFYGKNFHILEYCLFSWLTCEHI